MDIVDLRPGIVIIGAKWPEPVEIKKVDNDGGYAHIVGATTISGQHIDQLIPLTELAQISVSVAKTDFSSEPWKAFVALETKRYRFASLYDPLLAMNASKVDPLPHQIEAVYGRILKLPRIRFIIADDPGAGKTIMTGLIIKEMKLRHLIKRTLIIVPGHLKDQWRRELKDRFEENFAVIDKGLLGAHYGENVWEGYNQIITSMDFAKREEILPSLRSAKFDLVIVDEAHKMSAYSYGNKIKKTDRYRLGEALSSVADPHLLFLTATPHQGDDENFRLFTDLLEPGFFATSEMLRQSISSKDNPLLIRRMKEDLKDFEGKPLFLPRKVETLGFKLSDDEKMLYNDVSRYVSEQYNRALQSVQKRGIAFALVILQRRMASSTYAILKSLERRRERLNDIMQEIGRRDAAEQTFDFEEVEEMSEEDRWEAEKRWETLSVAKNRQEFQAEIETIGGLVERARKIIQSESEVKISQLKKTMERLSADQPKTKILIFTESKDTLDYLEKKIRSWGYSVNVIHGGMGLEERVEAERVFKNETQVMVATEAAGEGINLQFCNMMINYDIPWNPNRLEQRMGRIHRYGQTKEVFVYNLIATDTREGMVLNRLFEKLQEIKIALKSDRVFDVISEVIYGKDLSQLLLEAAANARNIDDILEDLNVTVDADYIRQVKENLGDSLATKYIDFTRLKEMAERARENRLIPEYTEAFFRKAFEKAGGRYHERKDKFLAIETIPFELRQISDEENFKKIFGPLMRSYPKVTFDKEIAFKTADAEFISFGHPLFEVVLAWAERAMSPALQRGSLFLDPEGKLDGFVLFYEGEVRDGTGSIAGKSLFAHYYDTKTGEVSSVSPTIVWDLAEGKQEPGGAVNVDDLKKKVVPNVVEELREYMSKIKADREKQADIKTKYGVKSLEKLIVKLDGELIALQARKDSGENVDLVFRNKEEQKKKYEISKKELEQLIEKETNLTMSMPSFAGIIRVMPKSEVTESMIRDDEIERIGMEITMNYERKAGREPEDVSRQNLGFDIRSRERNGNIRYIEVKARAVVGAIAMTQNEWFKAQRLGDDYYLYVVWNAGKDADTVSHIIQNPASNLTVDQQVEIVRYIVPPDEIERKAN